MIQFKIKLSNRKCFLSETKSNICKVRIPSPLPYINHSIPNPRHALILDHRMLNFPLGDIILSVTDFSKCQNIRSPVIFYLCRSHPVNNMKDEKKTK